MTPHDSNSTIGLTSLFPPRREVCRRLPVSLGMYLFSIPSRGPLFPCYSSSLDPYPLFVSRMTLFRIGFFPGKSFLDDFPFTPYSGNFLSFSRIPFHCFSGTPPFETEGLPSSSPPSRFPPTCLGLRRFFHVPASVNRGFPPLEISFLVDVGVPFK